MYRFVVSSRRGYPLEVATSVCAMRVAGSMMKRTATVPCSLFFLAALGYGGSMHRLIPLFCTRWFHVIEWLATESTGRPFDRAGE